MIEAIVFDFDGLILDTETPLFTCWREIFEAHGTTLTADQWADLLGRPSGHTDVHAMLEQQIGRTLDREQIRAVRKPRLHWLNQLQPIRPGIQQWLHDAKAMRLKVGVCSSSSRQWVEGNLRRLDIHHYFDVITCHEDAEHHKPDPQPFALTCQKLGVEPGRAIALEDSPNGVTSAKAAGLYTVAAPNPVTRLLKLDHADRVIESLGAVGLRQVMEWAIGDSRKA